MAEIQFNLLEDQKPKAEKLTVGHHSLKGNFNRFSGISGDFWINIIPSLEVSGYGISEEEALEDLKYNLNVFCEDLFRIDENKRHLELKKMGWSQNKLFKKKFSAAYVDKNGVLQNFDHPEQVKSTMLQTA